VRRLAAAVGAAAVAGERLGISTSQIGGMVVEELERAEVPNLPS